MLNEMSHGGELVNIKVLSKAHNEQIRAIVDDDERFREFQAKMRDESLYTNVAVAMALHKSTCEVILSEQPTLDSNPSTSTVDNGNKTGFFLSKAFEPLRRFSRCLSLGNSMVGTVTQAGGFFHRRCRRFHINSKWKRQLCKNSGKQATAKAAYCDFFFA
jgi:hypothetical protein